MTREETLRLLGFLKGCYPNTKGITDPATMAQAWEMCFGSYDAETIYKAARLHLTSCEYFPTIADIQKHIKRVQYLPEVDPAAITAAATPALPGDAADSVDVTYIMDFLGLNN